MKRKYVCPSADLISICTEDVMNGSSNILEHSTSGFGDEYSYKEKFGSLNITDGFSS